MVYFMDVSKFFIKMGKNSLENMPTTKKMVKGSFNIKTELFLKVYSKTIRQMDMEN